MSSEKTELPTSKKRQDAGKKGQSFKSRDLVVAVMLLTGVAVIAIQASALELMALLMEAIEDGFRQEPAQYVKASLVVLARIVAPILLACIAAMAAVSLYQSKFVLATGALGLKFESLNPVNGFKKLFSMRTVKDFIKTVLYLVLFAIAGVIFWNRQKALLLGQIHAQAGDLLGIWGGLLVSLVLTCLACIVIVLLLDVLAEIFLLTKDLKMEKQEVKREYKEQEGNPEVKARRRELHMEILSSQLKTDVEDSSFVVVNPTHIAVGVYYKPEIAPFPFISVIETDHSALLVKAYARKVGIPIVENVPLARRLFKNNKQYSFIEVTEIEEVLRILTWLEQVEQAAAGEYDTDASGDASDTSDTGNTP